MRLPLTVDRLPRIDRQSEINEREVRCGDVVIVDVDENVVRIDVAVPRLGGQLLQLLRPTTYYLYLL